MCSATANHLEEIWRKAREEHESDSTEPESLASEESDNTDEEYEGLLLEMTEKERELWRGSKGQD